MESSSAPKIAIIICSQRRPRLGPDIVKFVHDVLASHQNPGNKYDLVEVDLAQWDLPMFNESKIPSQVHDTDGYSQPHTRAWSSEVKKFAAFIFVCPQYNWGYPASVKNAIDYLYHEWAGKPAMIVSYGKRGGGRGAEQLKQVLMGVRMKVAETMPGLQLKTDDLVAAAIGGGKFPSDVEKVWESETSLIVKAFLELENLLKT